MYSGQSSPALLHALGASPDRKQPAKRPAWKAASLRETEVVAFSHDTAPALDQNS